MKKDKNGIILAQEGSSVSRPEPYGARDTPPSVNFVCNVLGSVVDPTPNTEIKVHEEAI